MISATFATLREKKGQCQWRLISPPRTETKTSSLAFQQQKEHTVHHSDTSPISISFLGLSKLITRSAFCTSISSSLRTGTVFLSTLSDAIHQTDNRDKSFLYTHFKPSKGRPGLRILLQIIQFTSNKLAVKF